MDSMLNTLRRIVQEVNRAGSLHDALKIIVSRIKGALKVDVCSVYLHEEESGELILLATDGLLSAAIGRVKIPVTEGLVGWVAGRAEPINIVGASNHPRYRYFPETGEERYDSFLGVPIIHHRQLLGVLILQQFEGRFSEEIESFLITIASQLAGAIAHAEVSGGARKGRGERFSRRVVTGRAGAPGIAVGRAVVTDTECKLSTIVDQPAENIKEEIALFRSALKQVKKELKKMSTNLKGQIPEDDRALFNAYRMLLDGRSFNQEIVAQIKAGSWAPGALRKVVAHHVEVFREMDDPYLRERANDIEDLGRRLLKALVPCESSATALPKNIILVAEEVSAAMLAEMPIRRLRGIVSLRGSGNSHTAILARALNIPAVLGVNDLPISMIAGRELVVDGDSGEVHLKPSAKLKKEIRDRRQVEAEINHELEALRDLPMVTRDGVDIELYVNSGLASDIVCNPDASGVGLYRTEFPFMVRDRFPVEDEQFRIYRKVLETYAPLPVTMRTLDIGGDKALPYFPIEEDNPFLGWRGIRFTLDHPEIFLVQIRAMLRANAGLGNLRIMLPMISDINELKAATILIDQAYSEIWGEYESIKRAEIGVMIEVPSAVYQVELIAQQCDFLSVGSNDLTQYLLAVDRNNPRVAEIYDSFHPAVLMALKQIVVAGKKYKKPVSICGEMAGDPISAMILLGLGYRQLSMNASSLLRVKQSILELNAKSNRRWVDSLLKIGDPVEIYIAIQKRFS
ncbi:MAG TPA: phosphoenolpyruvate--protein phosphotransferase [Ectothiorhodospiraceae bacterium]|nr:phosphoenolpyruvate--protein phosphotransferase [Ectothiorhodospiraceae bacterium]